MWHVRGRKEVHIGFWLDEPDRKETLGSPRRLWEDNIKMDLQHMRWGGTDWIDLAQDREGRL